MHFGHIADAIERNLDVRRSGRGCRGAAFFTRALCCAERATRAAGERVALTERIEDLTSHASRRVRAERGPAVAAIPLGSLHQTNEAPRDEVLSIRATATRIYGSGGDRSCELKVIDDARLDGSRRLQLARR
jgi:hypothetical protein